MTTETKTENTPAPAPASNDNKVVFAPLGKYAVVAVIMVSIIVTTAIMLDKQLKTVDEQLASIENKVAETHITAADVANTSKAVTADTEIKQAEATKEVVVETITVATTPTTLMVDETAAEPAEATTPEALAQPAQKTAATPVIAKTTQKAASAVTAQFKMDNVQNTAQTRQQQFAKENQARIEASKLEQKKHMTEMFARIKTLESQQLNRYKASQNSQIDHLREQVSQQQQMIDHLVLRNKKLFEMRAANMQRSQNNRKQMLNRI